MQYDWYDPPSPIAASVGELSLTYDSNSCRGVEFNGRFLLRLAGAGRLQLCVLAVEPAAAEPVLPELGRLAGHHRGPGQTHQEDARRVEGMCSVGTFDTT